MLSDFKKMLADLLEKLLIKWENTHYYIENVCSLLGMLD
jgi:hypothetical protein